MRAALLLAPTAEDRVLINVSLSTTAVSLLQSMACDGNATVWNLQKFILGPTVLLAANYTTQHLRMVDIYGMPVAYLEAGAPREMFVLLPNTGDGTLPSALINVSLSLGAGAAVGGLVLFSDTARRIHTGSYTFVTTAHVDPLVRGALDASTN